MGEKTVAIRLKTVGGDDARREVMSYADTGDAAAKRFAKSWVAADEQMEAMAARREQAQAKLNALIPQSSVQATAQASAGTGYDGATARSSAGSIKDGLVENAALDAKARALLNILEPLRAAQERYNVAIAEASRLHDTGRISIDQFVAAEAREAAILERATGAQRTAGQAAAAMRYQAAPDTTFVGKSAEQSAAAFGPLLAEQEKLTQRTNALRASIDPAFAAQQRFDHEMGNAKDLISRGAISLDDYCAKLRQETSALGAASRGHGEHANMLGLNRAQFITAESAVIRFSDAVMAGASPIRALMMEAHKGAEVLSMDEGGMAGGLAKVRGLLGPTTIGLAALTAVIGVGAAAWYEYSEAVHKLDRLSEGTGRVLGLTGDQLEGVAEASAKASDVSVGSAREIEASFLGIAKSGEVLTGLTAITRDFAAATGQDLKGAEAELGKAFADPIKGAQELAGKYGVLSQAQIEHIKQLAAEGDQTKVQIELLHDLGPAFQGAAENAGVLERAWHGIKKAADDAFNAMGHAIDVTLGGGTKMEQIEQLSHDRAKMLQDTMGQGDTSSYDKKIAALQVQLKAERDKDHSDRKNSQAEHARELVEQYTGDKRGEYRQQIGTIKAGLGALSPDEAKEAREQIVALTHAITSYVPAAQKANMIAADRSQMRQGRTPQLRAAARARLVEDQARGEVVTPGNAALRAQDAAEGYHNRANSGGEKHAQTLAREAAAMEVSARGAIDVAAAYLKSEDAGAMAEARRKALTDATKKGIDVDAQAARQMAIAAAEQVSNSAKAIATMNAESAARESVIGQLRGGKIATDDMDMALKTEAALRPLLAARAYLHGDALKTLNDVISATPAAIERANAAAVKFDLEKTLKASLDRAIELRAAIGDLAHTPLDAALNAANRAANNEADALHLGVDSPDRHRLVVDRQDETLADRERARAKYVTDTVRAQRDSMEITRAEIALAGVSDEKRTIELDKLRKSQEIRNTFPELTAQELAATLAGVEAQDRLNARLKFAAANMEEARTVGSQFVDEVLDPSHWSNWGDMAKKVLNDIEKEMLKLAILNPIKNALFGGSNPTMGGLFGSIFGGAVKTGSLGTPEGFGIDAFTPHNASGTENWSGGRTWVNENGPEIADLPSGTRIYPAALSRQMASNDNRGGGDIHVHQTFSNNFAGGAATMKDVQQMGQIAYSQAMSGVRDANRRAAGR